MIEINLLPATGKRRSARRASGGVPRVALPSFRGDPVLTSLIALGAVLLLAVGWIYWRTGAEKAELEAKIEAAVADSTRLSSTITLGKSLKAREDTVAKRIVVIQGVDERRYVWPHILDEMSRAVPSYTWLTKVTSAEAGDSTAGGVPSLTIEGNAGSTHALTRFMKNLELSPFIRDVTLVTSAQQVEAGRAFQRFTLQARYEEPDSSLIQTVPVLTME